MNSVTENVLKAIAHQETEHIPVVLQNNAPFLSSYIGVSARSYYQQPEVKLQAMLKFQEDFPQCFMLPGIYVDTATFAEAGALGGHIVWKENEAPWVRPCIKTADDILRLTLPKPESHALLSDILQQYRYLWDHLDQRYLDDYGYLDGVAYVMGPIETSSELMGMENFLMGMYDFPDKLTTLIHKVSDFIIAWLKSQEKVNGRLKRLFLADHMPTQMSKKHFQTYCLPAFQRIFDEFSYAPIRLYHNEGEVKHILEDIPKMGCNVYQFGTDLKTIKQAIGDRITLMGNLHPVNTFYFGSPEDIEREALNCIAEGRPGGGFLLSTAGGFPPGIPYEKIAALFTAAQKAGGLTDMGF